MNTLNSNIIRDLVEDLVAEACTELELEGLPSPTDKEICWRAIASLAFRLEAADPMAFAQWHDDRSDCGGTLN